MRSAFWLLLVPLAYGADACNPAVFTGSYAFQLAGQTNISGASQSTVALGRITLSDAFDYSGKINGTSSIKLAGFLLGNPVYGSYEAHRDCTVTWQLQDDSGAYQHFSGKYTPDGQRVEFRQTDTGGLRHGVMRKTPDSCNSSDLKPKYSYDVSGNAVPMLPGQTASDASGKGVIDTVREGDFQVDGDCGVHFTLTLASSTLNMRGYLVNGGKEILAFQTDPGAMVSARLTALP